MAVKKNISKASKKGKHAKRKGASGEREVAKLLQEYGFEAKRGVQFGKGDHDNPDVKHNIPNTHIEVKRTESLSLYKAYYQACEDAKEGDSPTVFHRRSKKEWLVVLSAEDYLKLRGGVKVNYDDMEF